MIIKESNINDYIQKSHTAKTSRMLIFITPKEKEAQKPRLYIWVKYDGNTP